MRSYQVIPFFATYKLATIASIVDRLLAVSLPRQRAMLRVLRRSLPYFCYSSYHRDRRDPGANQQQLLLRTTFTTAAAANIATATGGVLLLYYYVINIMRYTCCRATIYVNLLRNQVTREQHAR